MIFSQRRDTKGDEPITVAQSLRQPLSFSIILGLYLTGFRLKMDISLLRPSLYSVKGIIILDNDGQRMWANYYDPNIFASPKDELRFEKSLFSKTSRTKSEDVDVVMLDNLTILYKSRVDLYFYVLGGPKENELLLMSVLNCVFDSISIILRKNVEKSTVFENMDMIRPRWI